MNKATKNFWLSTKGLGALGLIAAASYFLLVEHREHLLVFLPYLILLACPLMHVFMHHGHNQHGSGSSDQESHESGGPHAP